MTRAYETDDAVANRWTEPDYHSPAVATIRAELDAEAASREASRIRDAANKASALEALVDSDSDKARTERLYAYLRGFQHGAALLTIPPKMQGVEDYERGYRAGARALGHAERQERTILRLPVRASLLRPQP